MLADTRPWLGEPPGGLGQAGQCGAGPQSPGELLASEEVLYSHAPLGVSARKWPCVGRTGWSPLVPVSPGVPPRASQPTVALKEVSLPQPARKRGLYPSFPSTDAIA